MEPVYKWRSRKDSYLKGLNYIQDRFNGKIKSIKTPWAKWNDAGVDGFEIPSIVVMAARPGAGKSVWKDNFVRKVFDLNPQLDLRVLDFDLELPQIVSIVREFCGVIGKTYKYLCSAEVLQGSKLTQEEIKKCYDYAKRRTLRENDLDKYPIDIIDESPTVNEFVEIVEQYMEVHKKEEKYTATIVCLDHARLIKRAAFESNENEMLYNLGAAVTRLKKKYPVVFIVLNHLNRNIDKPERNEDGKYGNYIVESDILGADALLQAADIAVGVNRPAKQQINYYGPKRFIIAGDDTILAYHFLKVRNGDTRLSFFRAEFHNMEIGDMDTPPCSVLNGGKKKEENKNEMKKGDLFNQEN